MKHVDKMGKLHFFPEELSSDGANPLAVNKNKLSNLIVTARKVTEGSYDYGYENLQIKIAEALLIRDNADVNQQEVNSMTDELQAAINMLSRNNTDFQWVQGTQLNAYTVPNEVGSGYYQYFGTDKVVTVPYFINGNPVTSYYRMFKDSSVEKIISTNPNLVNMAHMLDGNTAPTLDLSEFNTSNVFNMYALFKNTKALTLDVSNFNTSNLTEMSGMFTLTAATKIKGLKNLDTSKVTNMMYLFDGAKVESLDLTGFDTSNVTNMSVMFRDCLVETLDLSSFDTSKVTTFNTMFNSSKITNIYARTQEDIDKFSTYIAGAKDVIFTIK